MSATTDRRQWREIDRLRRTSVHIRKGVVTNEDPLCVQLGAATNPNDPLDVTPIVYRHVKTLGGAEFQNGDEVYVLKWRGDMVALGGVGDGKGGGGGGPFQPLNSGLTQIASAFDSDPNIAQAIADMSDAAQEILTGSSVSMRSTIRDTSYIPPVTAYGHSILYSGSSDTTRGIGHRFPTLLHTDVQLIAHGGAILTLNNSGSGATGAGGWDMVWRRTRGIKGTNSSYGASLARRGPTVTFIGVNDAGILPNDGAAYADWESFRIAFRAITSRFLMSNLWEEDDAYSFTAHRTSGDTTVDSVPTTAPPNIEPGLWITGTGIPANTKIDSIDRENQELELTNAATATGSSTLTVSAMKFDAGYTQAGADVDVAATNASNGYYNRTTTTNAAVNVAIPDSFQGDTAVLSFLCDSAGNGAVWDIKVDGDAAGSVDTRDVNIDLGGGIAFWLPVVYRATGLDNGRHTITATPSTIGGTAYFDCAWTEATEAPLVAHCKQYYAQYSYDPDVIDLLNQSIEDVTAEFPAEVFVVETQDLMDNDWSRFNDAIHPNDRGHSILAARVADEVTQRIRTQATHARGAHNFPFVARNPIDEVRNYISPALSNITPLTVAQADVADPQEVPLTIWSSAQGGTALAQIGSHGFLDLSAGAGYFTNGTIGGTVQDIPGMDDSTGIKGGDKISLHSNPGFGFGIQGSGVTCYSTGGLSVKAPNTSGTAAKSAGTAFAPIFGSDITASGAVVAASVTAPISGTAFVVDNPGGGGAGVAYKSMRAGVTDYVIGDFTGTADTVPRLALKGGGTFVMGPGGSSATDVAVYRGGTATWSTNAVLDLASAGPTATPGGGTATATGTQTGDKISLYNGGTSAAYGFGVSLGQLVAYVPPATGFYVREASATGQKSGSSTFADVYAADANLTNSVQSGYTELNEMTAPSSPGNDAVRLYAVDSGGTTALVAKFHSGGTVVIAEDF